MKSKEDEKNKPSAAVFKVGAIALAFLIVGYQAALFVVRAGRLRLEANRDRPDTVFVYNSDGVRDTLPQHMVTWQSQYFRLKEFEKWHGQEGFSDLPLKQVLRPLCERYHSYIWRKVSSLRRRALGRI